MASSTSALEVPNKSYHASRKTSHSRTPSVASFSSWASEDRAKRDPQGYFEHKLDEWEKLVSKNTPSRSRADIDDSSRRSPWSLKTVLSLDGGGVKGYSSLLIMKYLVSLIEDIEGGVRPYTGTTGTRKLYYEGSANKNEAPYSLSKGSSHQDDNVVDCYNYRVTNSEDCPWYPSEVKLDATPPARVGADEDLKAHIDSVLRRTEPCNIRLHHYFDYMAGTSTGGLSAIMLGRMEMSVQDALKQYDRFGNEIFGRPRPLHPQIRLFDFIQPKYPSSNMKRVLIDVVAEALRHELSVFTNLQGPMPNNEEQEARIRAKAKKAVFQSDEGRCRTMVVSFGPTDDSTEVMRAYIFRTYNHGYPSGPQKLTKHKHLNPGKAHRDPIWEVARATSAAPPYFSPINIRGRSFKDGAIIANNPAKLALAEVEQMHDSRPYLLLTVGTGRASGMENYKAGKKPRRYLEHWRHEADLIKKLLTQSQKTAINVEIKCAEEKDHRKIEHFRLNVEDKLGAVKLDRWQPPNSGKTTKLEITNYTRDYLAKKEVHKDLLRCAQMLVRLRRRRAVTEKWETFARRYNYICHHPDCSSIKGGKTYATRDDLRDHVIHRHQLIVAVGVEVMDDAGKHCPALNYVCTFDNCFQRVHAFSIEDSYRAHLANVHDIQQPTLISERRMEALLDWGRIPQEEALRDYLMKSVPATPNRSSSRANVSDERTMTPATRQLTTPPNDQVQNGHGTAPETRTDASSDSTSQVKKPETLETFSNGAPLSVSGSRTDSRRQRTFGRRVADALRAFKG